MVDSSVQAKVWPWNLLAAVIFTFNAAYWYVRHPKDTVGIIIFLAAAILFYIAALGNYHSGN